MTTEVAVPPQLTNSTPPRSHWFFGLTRITSSGKFVPEIDGFRFIAIASVFMLHDFGQVLAKNGIALDAERHVDFSQFSLSDRILASAVWTGAFGVQLFFVISGFILALPFAEHHLQGSRKPSLKAYFLRRITRLEPPYIVNMILCAIAVGLSRHWTLNLVLPHLGASLLYIHNQVYGEASTINSRAWSLEIEVQFYILAPLLAYIFTVRKIWLRRAILIIVCLGFAAVSEFYIKDSPRYQRSLLNAIQYFLAGFILADIYLVNPAFLKGTQRLRWDLAAMILGVGMIAAIHFGTGREGIWGGLPFYLPLMVLCFYIAGFKGVLFNRLLRFPPIFLIGGMCYTIYLYHAPLLDPLNRATRQLYVHRLPLWLNFSVLALLHAIVVLVICIILFKLVERPCMNREWPRLLWHRLRHWFGRQPGPTLQSRPKTEVPHDV